MSAPGNSPEQAARLAVMERCEAVVRYIAEAGKKFVGRTLEAYFAPPPRLRTSAAGGQVMLAWPVAATGYHLESLPALGSNQLWISNAAASAVTNGCIVVTQPHGDFSQFYRLRRP